MSYRDISEQLLYRGIDVSHETIRYWCYKFASHFKDIIKKKKRKPKDKWHLDEMAVKINDKKYILWRAFDSDGYELDIFLQLRRNKKSAIRFLSRLLGSYPTSRVIVTDKLKSYVKPIRNMCLKTNHRTHKRLNNRAENSPTHTRRKERCLIRFKSPKWVQQTLSLMEKFRNIFAVDAGRYKHNSIHRKIAFKNAQNIWDYAAAQLLVYKARK
ncbi:MAG: IS6 family transposase [Pseudomonadota bacterium]